MSEFEFKELKQYIDSNLWIGSIDQIKEKLDLIKTDLINQGWKDIQIKYDCDSQNSQHYFYAKREIIKKELGSISLKSFNCEIEYISFALGKLIHDIRNKEEELLQDGRGNITTTIEKNFGEYALIIRGEKP